MAGPAVPASIPRPFPASPLPGGGWLHEMKHDGHRLSFRGRGRKLKGRRSERGQMHSGTLCCACFCLGSLLIVALVGVFVPVLF